jgi:hypothetical protein
MQCYDNVGDVGACRAGVDEIAEVVEKCVAVVPGEEVGWIEAERARTGGGVEISGGACGICRAVGAICAK